MKIEGRSTIRKFSGKGITDGARPGRAWSVDDAALGATGQALKKHYFAALSLMDSMEGRKPELAKSGKYTPDGIKDQLKAYAVNECVPKLKAGRTSVERARAEVQAMRSSLPKPTFDQAGHAMRAEIRAWLRSMPDQQRTDLLKAPAPEMVQAIIEAPFGAMSGVGDMAHARLVREAGQALAGDTLVKIDALEKAIEITELVLQGVRDEVRKEAGFGTEKEFNEMAAPIESRSAAPWLRTAKEDGLEVTRVFKWDGKSQTGAWTIATQAEIESGVHFAGADDYEKHNPNWRDGVGNYSPREAA